VHQDGSDGAARESKSWRIFLISTGETTTEVKLAEDKFRKPRAGQSVRLLSVSVDRGRGFGAFDNGGPENSSAALVSQLKRAAVSSYGTAGPEFVRQIIVQGVDDIAANVREAVGRFTTECVPLGSDGQVARAAERFGLVAAAGELATRLGIVPWREGEARAAAGWALGQWIDNRGGTEPAEVRQAIEQVRLFIEQHGESRFDCLDDGDARSVSNRLGWRSGNGPERRWYFPPE
jgi:putative DNA primase/helicase